MKVNNVYWHKPEQWTKDITLKAWTAIEKICYGEHFFPGDKLLFQLGSSYIFCKSYIMTFSPRSCFVSALFDFHPFHCDKRSLTLLYCFAANILIHGAFICTSLIKSKNDNEAAGDLRHFFKSNWHTENLPSVKPTSWLEKKQVIFFFLSEFFFPYKAMFLPYRLQFQYIPGGAIQPLHGRNWQSIKEAFVKCCS